MRSLLLAAAAMGLLGCANFTRPLTPDLEGRVVGTAAAAVHMRRYAEAGLAASVRDCGSAWCVCFAPTDPRILDGGTNVRIDKVTGLASHISPDA